LNKKGIVPALAILIILGGLVAGVGIPVAIDKISGKDIGPENPIYGIERAGEAIQKAFGTISDEDLARERGEEASHLDELAAQQPERAEEYKQMAENLRREAQARIPTPISRPK
jgi:hypothetical protein